MNKITPFTFLNAINTTKDIKLLYEIKEYNPFIINRGLSYFMDTVLYANEMNRLHNLSKDMQFIFLINTIKGRKRFAKWDKNLNNNQNNIDAIKEYYGYSQSKAKVVMTLLSKEQIEEIKMRIYKGGTSGRIK